MNTIKKKRVSEEQKTLLLEYLESNTKLVTGKFSADFSYTDSCKKWEELKNILNAVGSGPNDRGVKEWKKTWLELKANAKEKKASTQKYIKGTGGGPKGKKLTEMEERIVALIGNVACTGIPGIREIGGGCSSATSAEEQQINQTNTKEDLLEKSLDFNEIIQSADIVIDDESEVGVSNNHAVLNKEVVENVTNTKPKNKRKNEVDDNGLNELIIAEQRKAAALERMATSFEKLADYFTSK